MIAVDTSVWVAALRSSSGPEAGVLAGLLDADEVALPVPVRVELLAGASNRDRPGLVRALSALPLLYPTDDTWKLIGGWVNGAAPQGQRFGMGDLLIAAVTHEAGALLWTLDADFDRMASLELVKLYEP